MQEHKPPVRIERVPGSSRSVAILAAGLAGVLLLALVKPWQQPPASTGTLHPASGSPTATGSPVVSDGGAAAVGVGAVSERGPSASEDPQARGPQCQGHDTWRIVTMERSGTLRTRTLFPVLPEAAGGPADPGINLHAFYAGQLLGIGYCVPNDTLPDVPTVEADVVIWQILPDGHVGRLDNLPVLDQPLYRAGEVYLGPPDQTPGGSTFPPGRYVYEVTGAGPGATALWFGLQFTARGDVALQSR